MIYATPEALHAARPSVHPSQRQCHVTPVAGSLHVACAVSNPERYASRYRLYRAFAKHMHESGVKLYTVELALGDRQFEIERTTEHKLIQLRSDSELWHKENLLDVAVRHFDPDWAYGGYVDADMLSTRPDWAVEAIHQLQHYQWVQLFSVYVDMDPHHEPYRTMPSFARTLRGGGVLPIEYHYGRSPGATGGGWAFRREAFDAVGGMLDTCILGSGDWHMAFGLAGKTNWAVETNRCTSGYIESLRLWCDRARAIRRSVGVVENTFVHYWHGRKARRCYGTRWKILQDHDFDPRVDLRYDWQGVLTWAGNKPDLEEAVRRYFRDRDEDSTEL